MNTEKSDSGVGAILWNKREHQSLTKVYFKFQSSSSYRTSKVLRWSNWYTLIYLKNCIKQGFSGPWKDMQ